MTVGVTKVIVSSVMKKLEVLDRKHVGVSCVQNYFIQNVLFPNALLNLNRRG